MIACGVVTESPFNPEALYCLTKDKERTMASSNTPNPQADGARSAIVNPDRPDHQPLLPNNWLIGFGVLLLLVGGWFGWRWWQGRGAEQAPPGQAQGLPVKLEPVQQSTIEESSEFIGSLESRNSVELRPEIEGRVSQIFVEPGQLVAAGTPIIQLSPEQQTADLAGGQAGVAAARADRAEAASDVEALRADRIAASAEVELQNQQYNRTASLVADGVLPEQDLDIVERDRQSAIAQRDAIDRQIQAAEATVAARGAAVAEAQASVDRAAADLGDATVTAPFAGTVGDIPIKVGDQVDSSSSLTSVTQNDTLELRLQVPLERRAELRQGLQVELSDQQGNNLAIGQISFISPQVDASAQSILAKASFNNAQNLLLNGQYVRARVVWQERPGILVPTAAISRIGGQAFVFVAKPPDATPSEPTAEAPTEEQPAPPDAAGQAAALVAEQRLVTLGDLQGSSYQVLEGLQAGEQIVVSGILNLSDGAPINPNAQPPAGVPPQ